VHRRLLLLLLLPLLLLLLHFGKSVGGLPGGE
jgi:hypothetical protein